MKKYDVVVIGGGPGGYVTAIRLGKSGKKTLLVEKNKFGGVCLNIGCIPSKALISVAHAKSKIEEFTKMNIFSGNAELNFANMIEYKNKVTSKLEAGIQMLLKASQVEMAKGEANFIDKNKISIKTEAGVEEVEFENAIIATGSIPVELPFMKYDHEFIIDSTDALSLKSVPKKFVVVGAGVIGLEMACLYSSLGSEVTVIEAMDSILPMVDDEATAHFLRVMRRKKINILLSSSVKGRDGNFVIVADKAGNETKIEAEKVLVGVGRRPFTASLGIEKAGVEVDSKGFIKTEKLRTTNKNVFAIGDVIGNPLLAHKASWEGLLAAKIICGGSVGCLNYLDVPSAIFTEPEMGIIGLTEKQAKEKGMNVVTGKFPFAALGRAQAASEIEGFVKVIAEKHEKIEHSKIIGVHIIGPHASDLIAEGALAVKLGASLEDVADTIHSHPTFAEGLAEACECAMGKAIHVVK